MKLILKWGQFMKIIKKILTLLLIAGSCATTIYSGPCLRLGQELSRRQSQKSSGKIDVFKQPLSGRFFTSKKISRTTKPISYNTSKKWFNNTEQTIAKLRKEHKQLKKDLDKIELLLLNFQLNQIEKENIEKRKKLEQSAKEQPEIIATKIPEPMQFQLLKKESELK